MCTLTSPLLNTIPYFLTTPHPPISTLFPYTTLFRSTRSPTARNPSSSVEPITLPPFTPPPAIQIVNPYGLWSRPSERSEEHTSEFQSLAYLVCRLLLEKKKVIEYSCNILYQSI